MWVPHKELKKKKIKPLRYQKEGCSRRTVAFGEKFFFYSSFFSFIFFLRFTETCLSDFVGINTKSALRDEGYA